MQKKGYVKIYRKMIDWEWFQDGNMLKAMLWLIINANTQDSKYRGIKVRRGSLVTSRKELSLKWSGKRRHERISEQEVRTILKRLQTSGEIIVNATSAFTLITICKYELYQGNGSIFDDVVTINQPSINHQSTINQPHNKNIRIQEDNILHTHTREDLLISEEEYANIKRRYNDEFGNVLHPCQRLTLNARLAIKQCLETFGRGSIDTVFKQLRQSDWLTGSSPSGWVPDILWIFTPKNYERILNGYYSAQKQQGKTSARPQLTETNDFSVPTPEQRQEVERSKYEETRQRWLGNINIAEQDPSSLAYKAVINAYHAGVLRKYGIDWSPMVSKQQNKTS